MTPQAIAEYLEANTDFFEQHPDLLIKLRLPHPSGENMISLVERQLVELRQRNEHLDKKLLEWIQYGQENDALQQKVHDFTVALIHPHDWETLEHLIPHLLQDIFAIPHASLQVWQYHPAQESVRITASRHSRPFCLHEPLGGTTHWLTNNNQLLRSFAYMPLHAGSETVGLLALASEDRQRYYPEMDTLFLHRIADIVSAALHPHLNLDHQR